MPWKWPNDSTNWIASANSASRDPCLMFDRNLFMPIRLASEQPRCPAASDVTLLHRWDGSMMSTAAGLRAETEIACVGLEQRYVQRPSRSQVAAKAPSSSSKP